jgi:hypothetical protein
MDPSAQPFAQQDLPRRPRNSCFTIVDFGLCQRIKLRRFGRTACGGGRAVIPLSCACHPSPSSHSLPTSHLLPKYVSIQISHGAQGEGKERVGGGWPRRASSTIPLMHRRLRINRRQTIHRLSRKSCGTPVFWNMGRQGIFLPMPPTGTTQIRRKMYDP